MDRDLIQRQDFPTGRRGYDIAAVDDHLRRVADAFETNTAPPAPPSLAATTSDQVREILEAAERSVTEVRTRAGAEAADHVAQVQAATDGMLAKLDHLESELTRLLSALRTSGEALNQGLSALQADVARGVPPSRAEASSPIPAAELPAAADTSSPRVDSPPPASGADSPAPPAPAPAAPAPAAPAPAADSPVAPAPAAADSPTPASSADSPPAPTVDSASSVPAADVPAAPAPAAADSPAAPAADSSPPDTPADDAPPPAAADDDAPTLFHADDEGASIGSDEASARLIALNMALNGNTREEAASYLAEHFELEDPDALLDDVFARAGR